MEKPITLVIKEFNDNLVKDINESGLPAYIIKRVLIDIINEIDMEDARQIENYQREQNMKTYKNKKEGK